MESFKGARRVLSHLHSGRLFYWSGRESASLGRSHRCPGDPVILPGEAAGGGPGRAVISRERPGKVAGTQEIPGVESSLNRGWDKM